MHVQDYILRAKYVLQQACHKLHFPEHDETIILLDSIHTKTFAGLVSIEKGSKRLSQ
jgi:hypothetical protein